MDSLRHHFGFRHDPFPQNVPVKDLFPLPALEPLLQRVFFALDQKAIAVVTGDVGSGKSTSLRYVSSKCHKSEYELITIVGGNFSPMELYRQILLNFGMSYLSFQVSIMLSKDQGAPPGHCLVITGAKLQEITGLKLQTPA
jgi:ABC-type molybdenum transport system ATPase subunit/photorepair protein PhrA